MVKKKEKFLLAPREQKEEFICVLLTHNSSRSSFLVAIFERGNRGDQASIRPWRLANYYNYRNWRCAIRPGKGQSRAPLRGYSSLSPSHQTDFHPCVPCIDYKYHDRVIIHTRAITQATDAGRIILPASLRFVLISLTFTYIYMYSRIGRYWCSFD